jgi:hypothetical protein
MALSPSSAARLVHLLSLFTILDRVQGHVDLRKLDGEFDHANKPKMKTAAAAGPISIPMKVVRSSDGKHSVLQQQENTTHEESGIKVRLESDALLVLLLLLF